MWFCQFKEVRVGYPFRINAKRYVKIDEELGESDGERVHFYGREICTVGSKKHLKGETNAQR